jgi:hypothetical protein
LIEPKQRRVGRPKGLTLLQDFGRGARETLEGLGELSFPCTQYQKDIVGFARDVLGLHPCYTLEELVRIRDGEDARHVDERDRAPCLWPRQIEILLAAQDDRRVAVSSGHKISKALLGMRRSTSRRTRARSYSPASTESLIASLSASLLINSASRSSFGAVGRDGAHDVYSTAFSVTFRDESS